MQYRGEMFFQLKGCRGRKRTWAVWFLTSVSFRWTHKSILCGFSQRSDLSKEVEGWYYKKWPWASWVCPNSQQSKRWKQDRHQWEVERIRNNSTIPSEPAHPLASSGIHSPGTEDSGLDWTGGKEPTWLPRAGPLARPLYRWLQMLPKPNPIVINA